MYDQIYNENHQRLSPTLRQVLLAAGYNHFTTTCQAVATREDNNNDESNGQAQTLDASSMMAGSVDIDRRRGEKGRRRGCKHTHTWTHDCHCRNHFNILLNSYEPLCAFQRFAIIVTSISTSLRWLRPGPHTSKSKPSILRCCHQSSDCRHLCFCRRLKKDAGKKGQWKKR